MTNHKIDNSLTNLGKTVLWQYDKAVRLLSILKHMQALYHCAVEQFWNFWVEKILSIENCGSFGCSIWGIFIGVPRPTIIDANGEQRLVATSVYRRILKGSFYLSKASGSFQDLLGYLEIVFGIPGPDNLSKWRASVSEYGWYTNVDELNSAYQKGRAFKQGDIFWYDKEGNGVGANWKCLQDITAAQNTSFDAIEQYLGQTIEQTNIQSSEETLLLKLYDPSGICRSIGGGAKDTLEISTSYEMGGITVTASVNRNRKCGVKLTDNGDMSMTYSKSEWYDEMHRDQKAIFEQREETFCPYPLGIKTNEIAERCVLGFGRDPMPQGFVEYIPGHEYPRNTLLYIRLSSVRMYQGQLREIYFFEEPRYYFFRTAVPIKASDHYTEDQIVYSSSSLGVHDFFIKIAIGGSGNIPYQYKTNTFFPKGLFFAYTSGGETFNYECQRDISASENVSFEAIQSFVKKTRHGGPPIGGFVLDDPPYVDLRRLHMPYIEYGKQKGVNQFQDEESNIGHLIYSFSHSDLCMVIRNGMNRIVKILGFIYIQVGLHASDENYKDGILIKESSTGSIIEIFVREGTKMEKIMQTIGDIAVEKQYPEIPEDKACIFDPSIRYHEGMEVLYNGKRRSITADLTPYNSPRYAQEQGEADLLANSYPSWKTTLIGE